jgi:hypothetical protein
MPSVHPQPVLLIAAERSGTHLLRPILKSTGKLPHLAKFATLSLPRSIDILSFGIVYWIVPPVVV